MATELELARRKELILESEMTFANKIGAAVFEKPKVNMWMIMLPILFLYFIYRMQSYKRGRMKFDEDFMVTRRRVMDVAFEAVQTQNGPDLDRVIRQAEIANEISGPYASWVRVLAEYYMDLLVCDGNSFESLESLLRPYR